MFLPISFENCKNIPKTLKKVSLLYKYQLFQQMSDAFVIILIVFSVNLLDFFEIFILF